MRKKPGDTITLHMCTKNYDQMMYGSWDMVHNGRMDGKSDIKRWVPHLKIKSAIPREQNYAAWLVKNRKAVFSKLTWKIPLSVTGKQVNKHLASSFPFSYFYILSSCLGCYFSGKSCTFHFGQMSNGFWTSSFDFYWSLVLQFSYISVRLSEGKFQ